MFRMASRALMVLVSKLEGREDGSQLSVSGKDLWFKVFKVRFLMGTFYEQGLDILHCLMIPTF